MAQRLTDIANMAQEETSAAGIYSTFQMALTLCLRPGTVRTRKRVNVKKQKTKVTYSLTANPPATTTLLPGTDPELAQDEVLETIQDGR